ncbi:MAG: hypothetical protein SLAVMIC_00722 [uncultured marine phage]|uniref:Uncharacterized protein n=1 Tax=uncultured marine phage TaxID=707152 RepID=A0A8D9CCN7_9VIRU|nr:MAG: hypothetical protein SLAVMIC_00722 [uncultured marine phage]
MNYSEKLKDVLNEINDPVSQRLLELEGSEQDIDNVDISTKEGYISFNRDGREARTRIKAGRFVSTVANEEFTPREIEVFFNQFKSIGEYHQIKDRFELGSGDDFEYCYTRENYAEQTGSLRGSCMTNVGAERLRLYMKNPKKIKILMLKDEDGGVLGRAIVWRNSFVREGESAEDRNNSETFKVNVMDRVYTTKDYLVHLFERYASEQGWYVKSGYNMEFKRPDGEQVKCRVKCNLKDYEYGNYPYLDTMRSISKKGTISNKRWKGEVRFY